RRLVEHDGAVTDQRLFPDGAVVDEALVPHGDVAPDFTRATVEVHHRIVLDVRALTDQYPPEVRAQHRAVPDRRVLLHDNVTDQRGGRRHPGFGMNTGRLSLECEVWHAHTVVQTSSRRVSTDSGPCPAQQHATAD